jgi:cobalt-zinc-cadmium efflux system protein
VPSDIKLEEVHAALTQTDGVITAHHLHVWQLDEQRRALEVHLVTQEGGPGGKELKMRVRTMLEERFRIEHCCLEIDTEDER